MNKADEARLKKDPRYKSIMDAKSTLDARRAAAQAVFDAEMAAARAAYVEAAPEMKNEGDGAMSDEHIFAALRPRGDKVRVEEYGWLGAKTTTFAEVEHVTPTTVTLVNYRRPFRNGFLRADYSGAPSYTIHEEDMAKIRDGKLKGWRDKPWGKP